MSVKNLKEGEYVVGNQVTESYIKFSENGDIEVVGTNDQVVTIAGDCNVTITGNHTINTTGNTILNTTGNTELNTDGDVDAVIGGALTAGVTGNTDITSPIITLTGELRVTGDITAFYGGTPIVLSSFKTAYNAHTHISAAPGNPSSTTSLPI